MGGEKGDAWRVVKSDEEGWRNGDVKRWRN